MVMPLTSRFAVLPNDDDGSKSKRIKANNQNKKKEEQPKAQTISNKKPEVKKDNTGTKKKLNSYLKNEYYIRKESVVVL
ncbi:hypothetical protein J6590_095990 [Homalodisca vitripennis]|nr:hypothetical protein J6590_095990 [Homalodisca vitripennis]